MFHIRDDYWWHWYLNSEILWHINQLVRRKLILLWFVCTHTCKQKQTNVQWNRTCWQQVQIRWAGKAVFYIRYIVSSTNMSKHSKNDWNKQYFTCSLNALMGYSTSAWILKKAHIVSCQETRLQISACKAISSQQSFPSRTIPDCIRYIIGVFCCNFKSQTNILSSY